MGPLVRITIRTRACAFSNGGIPPVLGPKNVLCTQFGVDFRVKGDPLNLPEKTIKFSSKMVLAKCPVGKDGRNGR